MIKGLENDGVWS